MQVNVDIVQRVAREFPGFVSATVHRSLDGTRVINYLHGRRPQTVPPSNGLPVLG